MMMQHRITMMHGDKEVDVTRALPALDKTARKMRRELANLQAASIDRIDETPESARWFCLQVKKDCEFSVEKSLFDARIKAFMPREKWFGIRRGRKIEKDLPYFPGYLLVRIVPAAEAFQALRDRDGVVDIVGGATGSYHVVRDVDVDVLMNVCDQIDIPRARGDRTMKDGDKASIVVGPFVGFDCVVTSVKWCRQAKASVRIDVHGRPFDIDSMPIAFLKKL